MNVILLERIARLGQMGDVVRVKDGYARNFLLPQGKALRASETNLKRFENDRAQLEARNLERRNEAEAVSEKLDGHSIIVVRSAGETGQLYGSVTARDVAIGLDESGFTVGRSQISLNTPIKTIGLHSVNVALHPEVAVSVTVNVARTADEAERQAAGEDLTRRNDDFEFEPGDFDLDDDGDGEEDAGEEDAGDAKVTDGDDAASRDGPRDGTEEETIS